MAHTQSSKEEATQVLLEEQFQYTEAYCNATTALHNALQQVAGAGEVLVDLHQATKEYQDALDSVQNNLQALTELVAVHEKETGRRNAKSCLTQHLERTRRVLATIYQSGQGAAYYSNGIPIPSSQSRNNNNNARLVALATLRASIQSVTAEN